MRSILLFLSLMLCVGHLDAQKRLKHPLTFVPADSVVLWGQGYSDLRGMGLSVNASLTEQPVRLTPKTFRDDLKRWQRDWLPDLTLTGAGRGQTNDAPALRSAQLLDVAAPLFLQTGHADFMEAIERALFNDLLHEVMKRGPNSFEKNMAAGALVNGTGMIYAVQGSDVWVNLYTNNTTRIKTPELSVIVDQLTGMPFEGLVKVRLSGFRRNGTHLRIHLRIPHWAEGRALPDGAYTLTGPAALAPLKFYVNGRDPLTGVVENGYYVIDRQWNSGDEVMIELPMTPMYVQRAATVADKPSPDVALRRGPLLYAVPDSCAAGPVDTAQPLRAGTDASEQVVLQGEYARSAGPGAPVTTFTARPYFDTDGRLWLPTLRLP